ncbi:hypothetical protein SDC9_06011 [bioreactor metagenome]|uniref:Uncharacterized protein n=1 Tax=bioreactor metagenome TaxID=1076179 RepID=A0A644T0I3_9ZZZZ
MPDMLNSFSFKLINALDGLESFIKQTNVIKTLLEEYCIEDYEAKIGKRINGNLTGSFFVKMTNVRQSRRNCYVSSDMLLYIFKWKNKEHIYEKAYHKCRRFRFT